MTAKVEVMRRKEAQALWDRIWAKYLKIVEEQGYEMCSGGRDI